MKMIVNCYIPKTYPRFNPLKMWVTLVVVVLFVFLATAAYANTLKIKDGDSFVLNGVEIRLWGIDAPEYNQFCQKNGKNYACGRASRAFLKKLLNPLSAMTCKQKPRAQKETRQVSQCFINGADIGSIMVQKGHAIDYSYFSKGHYANEQTKAKDAKIGVWAGEFMNPRQWRKNNKW